MNSTLLKNVTASVLEDEYQQWEENHVPYEVHIHKKIQLQAIHNFLLFPEPVQSIFIARYFLDLSYSDIEVLYGISYAKGKLFFYRNLLAISLSMESNSIISDKSMNIVLRKAMKFLPDFSVAHPRNIPMFPLQTTRKILASALLLLTLSFATLLLIIPELRANLVAFLIQRFPTYSIFQLHETPSAITIQEVHLDYIPHGFVLTQEYTNCNVYTHPDGYSFEILVDSKGSTTVLDTENASIESLVIQQNPAYYWISNSHTHYLAFEVEDSLIFIYGDLSQKELIKIAENLTY